MHIMNRNAMRAVFLPSAIVLVVLSTVAANRLWAQDNPFEGPGAPPVAPGPAPATGGTPTPPADEQDPVVLAVRESNPTTASELLHAVDVMLNRGRADEARRYFDALIALNPDEATLAALHADFDSAFFLRLSRVGELAPQAQPFSRAVMDAAYKAARDPAVLRELVARLSDPAPEVRRSAVVDLRSVGADAVAPLLAALADGARADEHAAIQGALVALGGEAVEPLIGALDAPPAALRARVIEVLGQLNHPRAVMYLIRPYADPASSDEEREAAGQALLRIVGETPATYDAQQYLYRRAKNYFAGSPPREPGLDESIVLWHWDESAGAPLPRSYPASDAALVVATQAAGDLYALAPDAPTFRRLYIATLLETAKSVGGYAQPLEHGPGTAHDAAATAGVEELELILKQAMKDGHIGAALGAAEILGDIGDERLLTSDDGRERPLVQALRHGDRRLRFVAAEAILRIDPTVAYPGASRLAGALGYFAGSVGERRVLIGNPRPEHSQSLLGMLREIGFDGDSAQSGRRTFQMAVDGSDYELILLSDAIDFPRASELIQALREDPRTAALPIGLLAREEKLTWARRLAETDPLVEAFPRPHDTDFLAYDVARLLELVGRNHVSQHERQAQAEAALDWMALLLADKDRYRAYDFSQHQSSVLRAFNTPALTEKATPVMGRLASQQAQVALVSAASEVNRPIAERQAAARAFAESVDRYGILLTAPEILRQYDRYNESAGADRETQVVLGSLLDSMEQRGPQSDESP